MKAVLVSLAIFPMFELQRELFYIVKETAATKITEYLNRPRWPPEDSKRLDANGDDEILIVRMDLSIVLSDPQ